MHTQTSLTWSLTRYNLNVFLASQYPLGMGIRLNCLNRSSGELMIDFRLIINIFILKFTICRLYENAVKIEKTVCYLIEIFITR